MAKTRLDAPKGKHFMVNKQGGFYLMKNPASGYREHKTSQGEKSSLYIVVELREYHETGSTAPVSKPTQRVRQAAPTRTAPTRVASPNRTSSTSSSGSSSSGGGGY